MKFIISIFLLLLFKITFSQVVELTGAIIIGNSEMMSYRIVYEIGVNNVISGYSLADLNGNSETKARITGVYNPQKRTLKFEEKVILSTKAKLPFSDFCLMTVDGKFEKKNGKHIYTGSFASSSLNKRLACDKGTIVLATTQDIYDLAIKAKKIIGKTPSPDSSSKAINEILSSLEGVDKVISLLPESITEYALLCDSIQIDVLDDRLEDGDKITIIKNRTPVISELVTSNKMQTFKFDIGKDESVVVFTIVACNEGKSPPNTIKVILSNGKSKELLIAQLKKDQHVKILFRRK